MATHIMTKQQFIDFLKEGLPNDAVILITKDLCGSVTHSKNMHAKTVQFGYGEDCFKHPDNIADILAGEVRPFSYMVTSRDFISETALKILDTPAIKEPPRAPYMIRIDTDASCKMNKVSLNDKCIMEGNSWDFHPGCHGITKYGNFKGAASLGRAIKDYLINKNKIKAGDIRIINRDYKYS